MESFLELNYKSLILCIVKLCSSLVLNLESLVVIKDTCSDETELILRVDLSTLVVSLNSLILLTELIVDVTLNIVERSIVRLVLLCKINKFEASCRILLVLNIIPTSSLRNRDGAGFLTSAVSASHSTMHLQISNLKETTK